MPDSLYERDALAWSEEQADLLRRLASGERVNDAIDWPNVIEELQDVGLSQLRAVRSLLRQAILHLLKLQAWPDSLSASHWRSEVLNFLGDARDAFAPSMRQRIDLAELHAEALSRMRPMTDESGPRRSVAGTCPFSLDELLVRDPDPAALVAKLDDQPGSAPSAHPS